jgi:hypothetical protein
MQNFILIKTILLKIKPSFMKLLHLVFFTYFPTNFRISFIKNFLVNKFDERPFYVNCSYNK